MCVRWNVRVRNWGSFVTDACKCKSCDNDEEYEELENDESDDDSDSSDEDDDLICALVLSQWCCLRRFYKFHLDVFQTDDLWYF